MIREALVATLLLATALAAAGCLTPPIDEAQAASAEDTVGTASATTPAPPAAPYYVLEAEASPAATLTSFWWRVPEGAVYKEKVWNEYDTTVIEAALLTPDGKEPALTEWALLAFAEDAKGLRIASGHYATPMHGEAGSPVPVITVSAIPSEVETAPFHFSLGYDAFEEGDRVAFVLVARAEETTPLRLAFRVLPEAPDWPDGDEPAASAEAFLQQVEGLAPNALATESTGDGFQVALHLEMSMGAIFPYTARFWTDAVDVDREMLADASPFAASGVRRISAAFEEDGWSAASGIYWGDVSAGTWRAEVGLHGTDASGEGLLVQSPATSAATIVTGLPYFFVVADGEGASASTLEVDTTAVNAEGWELLAFDQVDLGATMGDLFGAEARHEGHVLSGLVPAAPTTLLATPGGDLARIAPGGFSATWQGLALPRA